jgi:hypothetical protein
MDAAELYIGHDLTGGGSAGLEADHLTTHGVCFGMTGSGKTGLGIVLLEELARRGVPLLVIDLKGDMVNLLLNFPELEASQFEPWIPEDQAAEGDRRAVAEAQAALWRKGLAGSGLGPDDLRSVRDGVRWQLITPGSAAVAPLDILPALSAPEGWSPTADPDGATDRVNDVAGALLSLVGRGGDALTDRDTVLVASILLEHWRRGDSLDLAGLLGSIADPPMEVIGALPMESFYPRGDRMKLVMDLNALVASPAFSAWTRGTALTADRLLGTAAEPIASVVSVAHLDERERLFALGLLVSELVSWMRGQSASSGLRALLYMDEVHGILPPHPANPPTKGPLLTLLKQGRAFGVGAWLATQNPVDIDYKAVGNAGVKVVGRLITERDRDRVLDGLGLEHLEDGTDVDDLVAGLGKRQFLLHDVRARQRTRTFSSRWAMSYLRGPVTLGEMGALVDARPEQPATSSRQVVDGGPSGGSASPPVLSADMVQRFAGGGGRAEPSLIARCGVSVRRVTLGIDRSYDELWRIPTAADGALDFEAAEPLDAAPPTSDRPTPEMRFPRAVPAALDNDLERVEAGFVSWRARMPVTVLANRKLKLSAEPGEGRDAFEARCLEAADRADDAAQERARARYERRIRSLEKRLARERHELESDRTEARSRKAEEVLGLVEGLFSVLTGSRSVSSASRKASAKMRSAATRRRMSSKATADVVESESEIERIERELELLGEEMQDEIDRIAERSEETALNLEEVAIRPAKKDIAVREIFLLWE